MMKITLTALAALVFVIADDANKPEETPVTIVKQDSDVDVNKYSFDFKTSDGTSRQEEGEFKNDTDQQGLSVKGSYKYVAPDGQHIAVTYIADKNGYQPTDQKGDQSSAASDASASGATPNSAPSASAPAAPAASAADSSPPAEA